MIQPDPVCECGHAKSSHEPVAGICLGLPEEAVFDGVSSVGACDCPSFRDSLSMREQQMQEYQRRTAEWQRQYNVWRDNGGVGSPPPYPVRPHTPGAA